MVKKKMNSKKQSESKKTIVRNYVVALLLSIFLGGLGIDRFYVNHIVLGILKLITLGGFGIWYIVDIILFATKNINNVTLK